MDVIAFLHAFPVPRSFVSAEACIDKQKVSRFLSIDACNGVYALQFRLLFKSWNTCPILMGMLLRTVSEDRLLHDMIRQ